MPKIRVTAQFSTTVALRTRLKFQVQQKLLSRGGERGGRHFLRVAPAGRMTFFVRGFDVMDAQMEVDGGGFELRVTHHQLDMTDVASIFQQGGGKGMAKGVTTAVLTDVPSTTFIFPQWRQL